MNLFQLVLKQMRQRALGTWLTLLSVLLGVALATAVIVFQREGERLFAQADFGYDVLVGPARGSPLQLTLNSIYHLDVAPGLLDYEVFKQLQRNRGTVRLAIPTATGDTYEGLPIVGTSPRMFNHTADVMVNGQLQAMPLTEEPQPIVREGPNTMAPFEYRTGKSYELAEGRMFHPRRFEAVIGSEVTLRTKLQLGDLFHATHGMPGPNEAPDVHEDKEWRVVGRLARTGTSADRVIFIPLLSFYALGGHEEALTTINAIQRNEDVTRVPKLPAPGAGRINEAPAATQAAATMPADPTRGDVVELDLPESEWKLSAVFVRARSAPLAMQLIYTLNNSGRASASNPAMTMREFFNTFLKPSTQILFAVAVMVSVVAGVGVLVAIYNSVSARMREIAILRALGATRGRILVIICMEAGLIGLAGAALGVLAGHGIVAVGQRFIPDNLGEINPLRFGEFELLYLGGVVVLSVLAGLVPALKAYRVPVAENLTA